MTLSNTYNTKITQIFALAMVLLLSSCDSNNDTDPSLNLTYIKASNTDGNDEFGTSIAMSGDGNTIVVGATGESSNATGVDGDQTDNTGGGGTGAVYVFDAQSTPVQQAYIKASNSGAPDEFGASSAMSDDGNTIVVGAKSEGSNATGVGGDETNNSASGSGAVYVFSKTATAPYWTKLHTLKHLIPILVMSLELLVQLVMMAIPLLLVRMVRGATQQV